jgi:hypothetical protein
MVCFSILFQVSKLMDRLGRKISLYHVCPSLCLADERLDTIYSVYGCFHNMSTKNAASLEAGVEDILEYQDTQSTFYLNMELMLDEIRQTLVDFRNGVAQISQRFVTKPEGSRGGTPQGGR